MMKPTSATTVKSKSTMYLNEESFHSNQGNIVRFLRSLVLSKNNSHGLSQGKLGKSRVFGRDLKLHLTETRQESKFFENLIQRNILDCQSRNLSLSFFQFRQYSEFAPSAQSIVALLMAFTDFQGFHQISELSSKFFKNPEFIFSKEIIIFNSF